VVLLATACGTAVASNYYAQPLLYTIGAAPDVADATADPVLARLIDELLAEFTAIPGIGAWTVRGAMIVTLAA
jgi:3-methyladenine DNA glycosylase/8-oxoguanine DNA glycosylase